METTSKLTVQLPTVQRLNTVISVDVQVGRLIRVATCCHVGLKYSHTLIPLNNRLFHMMVLSFQIKGAAHSPASFCLFWFLSQFLSIIQMAFLLSDSYSIIDLWPALSKQDSRCVPFSRRRHPLCEYLLSRKMDHPSLTPLPSSSPSPPTWLRNRLYLVSQLWWGEQFVRRSLPESRNQPITRLGAQYTTVHPKTKGLNLPTPYKQLKRNLCV